MQKVFVYTIVTDAGFAPNADGRYLTLATCKPLIRKHAQVGDIIIAHHKKARGGREKTAEEEWWWASEEVELWSVGGP